MYLTVMVKDTKVVPLDIADSDAIARAQSNALQNRQFDAFIFQGPKGNLEQFATALRSKNWTPNNLKSQIEGLSKSFNIHLDAYEHKQVDVEHIVSQLEFDGFTKLEAQKVISHVLETEKELKIGNYRFGCIKGSFYDNSALEIIAEFTPKRGPGKGTYPKHINQDERNKKIWQFVIKNFLKHIQRDYPDDFKKQWVAAALIYQRVCLLRRLKPWMLVPSHTQNEEDSRNKVILDSEKADDIIDEIFVRLDDEAIAKEIGDEKPYDVIHKENKCLMITTRELYLHKNIQVGDLFRWLSSNFGFSKFPEMAVLRISALTLITFQNIDGRVKVLVTFELPKHVAQGLVENKSLHGEELAAMLKRLLNVWFQTGRLKFRKKDL